MQKTTIRIFSAVLLFLVAMSILLWTQFESIDLFKKTDRASYQIEYLDEVLTMSARMAAFTGDEYWVERYHNHVKILDDVLLKAKQDDNVKHQLQMISDANNALVAIELRAIDLVKNGQQLQAQQILSDEIYQRYKNTYTKGIKDIAQYVNQQVDENTNQISSNFRYSLFTIILLFIIASAFGLYIVNILQGYNSKLLHMTDELDVLARTDALTGLYNRRYCDEYLDERIKVFHRFDQAFSLILLDIDYFKSINDNFGHEIGDDILKEIAKTLSANIREVDKVFRWGGEEFVIILPYTDIENSALVAEKIRQKIENHNFKIDQKVTASLGVVQYSKDFSAREFMEHADQALYQAKQSGRNLVKQYQHS